MGKKASQFWHQESTENTAQLLQLDPLYGLSDDEACSRLKRYGFNRLKGKKGKNPFVLFISQFHHPLIYILLISALVTGFLKGWIDSAVIAGVVLINAAIGFIQEMNALRSIEALASSLSISAAVLRNGNRKVISAEELVPGDMVFLQSGDKVPADLRLLRVRDLQIDESALTGESLPAEKSSEPLPKETILADRSNMAFSSTLVIYGTGVGVAVETGDTTEIGRINRMISDTVELETPLTRKIGHFSLVLMWFIFALAAITFAIGLWRGESWVDMFIASVALAVATIPEGLPVAVTITLAIGVRRMAKRHAIIRKLPAVETLGSTTIICSDKTGTLTQNQMTVRSIYTGGIAFDVTGIGYVPLGEFLHDGNKIDPAAYRSLQETLKAGLLCNDSRLIEADDSWLIEGDPTEGALIVSAQKADLNHAMLTVGHPRLDTIPFESAMQFMATLHHNQAEDIHHIYLKGSVESILSRCTSAFDPDLDLIPLERETIHKKIDEMAAQGYRVLAFARGEKDADDSSVAHHHVASGLSFLGLQGMIDPPRPEAVTAVTSCQNAGIRVKMITGDHIGTAVAIAKQMGLVDSEVNLKAIDGKELAAIKDEELPAVAEQTHVFARVAPEQKLRLVQALQSAGHIIAMTGDGVNDAPALHQADIGVAMGISGTEVSKEAAAMVLTDDNFASITAAVEEGRGVYDNLVKFLTWTLPTNIGQGLVIFIAIFANIELPILPGQILWINMTTAVFLGLALAFEAKESGIMLRPPHQPNQPLLSNQLIFRTVFVGLLLCAGAFGLFEWEMTHEDSINKARTAAVNFFCIGQSFYLLNCRSLTHSAVKVGLFSNPWVWIGILAMIVAQIGYIYTPILHVFFHSEPIGQDEWILTVAGGFVIYCIVGLEKLIRRWKS